MTLWELVSIDDDGREELVALLPEELDTEELVESIRHSTKAPRIAFDLRAITVNNFTKIA